MRLAAIDLGTNSVHMVIADVTPDGRIVVVDRVKEMVRLGRKAFTTGRLAPETMRLASKALRTFGRLARARKVQRLRTVATSAVREARNGAAFVARLRRETGMPIKVISGLEEARLIFQAARHAIGLEGGPHLLVDVGGGSVELSLAYDGKPMWLESLPLGVARLTDTFFTKDPPSEGQVQRLERHLEREMGELLERAKRAGAVQAVGTSGTINTLVAMALAARGEESARLHGAHASADEISRIRRRVLQVAAADRTELPGMDQKRIDLMPAAVVLVDTILQRAGGPDLVACAWALREGVLLDLAGVGGQMRTGTTGVRRRSVEALAHRWVGADVHGRHVSVLARQLFDALAGDLGLPIESREMLEYAALLHDVGRAVEHDRHQRHTYYIIKNSELLGFSPVEIEMLAQVARGHRKQPPRLSDAEGEALTPGRRRVVRGLAALLRVADALDRTRQGVISSLDVSRSEGRLVIRVDAGAEQAELELWAAERRTDLLGRLLDRPILLRAGRTGRAGRAPERLRARGGR